MAPGAAALAYGVIAAFSDTAAFVVIQNKSGQLVTAAPAGAGRIVVTAPPVVLGPQQFAVVHLWFPGNAATPASFSMLDVGVFER